MKLLTQGKTNWKYILIVATLAIMVGGGILGCHWWAEKKENGVLEIEMPERLVGVEKIKESSLDNRHFLNLMFPEKKLEKINIKTFKDVEEKYDKYRVENIFRASFTEPGRKELIVIVKKTPTYHVTGLYNAYVAVFDEKQERF